MKSIPARYRTRCPRCGGTIGVGDPITKLNGAWGHPDCKAQPELLNESPEPQYRYHRVTYALPSEADKPTEANTKEKTPIGNAEVFGLSVSLGGAGLAVLDDIATDESTLEAISLSDGFSPSSYQAAIYNWLEHGTGHAVVIACPGSGKTTTLKHSAPYLPKGKRIVALAFGKKNAKDLQRVMPEWIEARTFHSLALKNVMSAYGRGCKVEERKGWKLLDELTDQLYAGANSGIASASPQKAAEVIESDSANVLKLVGLMKNTLETDLEALSEHYGITVNGNADIVYELAQIVFHRSIDQARTWVDFDDMIYLCATGKVACAQYDFILVDETQDQNRARLEMMVRMLADGGRVLAVGDPCQPTGTLIDVVIHPGNRWHKPQIEKRPIEKLKEGDMVVSIKTSEGSWTRSKHVQGITSRTYNGDLIIVTLDHLKTRYTINHHCYANFSPHRNRYCVYLMRKGNQFRIGHAKMDYGSVGSGLVARMQAETADAGWILSLHDSKVDVFIQEQVISAKFGLPQLMFTSKSNGGPHEKEILARAWNQIGENENNGLACLSAYGRHPDYPLLSGSIRNWKSSLKRPMLVHAANLMEGCLMLPYPHGNKSVHSRKDRNLRAVRKSDWKPITVSHEFYSGLVWSMTIEDHHTYVGDGILTHNCQSIFGFAGADTTAIPRIIERLNAAILPLSISYRLPLSHVKMLNDRFPDQYIEARPGAVEGEIVTLPEALIGYPRPPRRHGGLPDECATGRAVLRTHPRGRQGSHRRA